MGGHWSNHLHALAYACQKGWPSVGLVRGLVQNIKRTPVLVYVTAGFGYAAAFCVMYRLSSFWTPRSPLRKQLLPGSATQCAVDCGRWRSAEALRGLRKELTIEAQQQLGADPDYLVCCLRNRNNNTSWHG